MVIIKADWQSTFQVWSQRNPKTILYHLQQLREDFVQKFPIESLEDMTLDRYAIGRPHRTIHRSNQELNGMKRSRKRLLRRG